MRLANAFKATRQIADEALYRSTFGSGPGILPAASFIVYVMKGGSDATGNGTDEFPFVTASKGLAFAHSLGPSAAQLALVLLGPGVFPENVAMPPFVYMASIDPGGFTPMLGTGVGPAVTLSAAWAAAGPNPTGGIEGITLNGSSTIDFTGVNAGQFAFFQQAIDAVSVTGDPATGGFLSVGTGTDVFGALLLTGATLLSQGMIATAGISLVSTAVQPAGWESDGDTVPSPVTLDATAGKNVTAALVNTGVTGQLTLHDGGGGVTSYTATAEGIPGSVVLLGGAASPVLSTRSNAIGYTATVPGNWAGAPPMTVQQALDRIAAKTPGA